MTSTAPTRPARNCQVSSRNANDDDSVGLSAAGQNLLSAKPIFDSVKSIAKLTLFLPETVPLATEEDDIPRRIFELEGEDGMVASIFNCRVDILFREHVREDEREKEREHARSSKLAAEKVVPGRTSARPWFIDILSTILTPASSSTLMIKEVTIAYSAIYIFSCSSPTPGERILGVLDTALMAHPACPSIKW
ncbi:hypothetical protein B0H19DRAFT_1272715 [Mycena capillaripes]|nr:hypothetical protein B0H19DRAFT_1272715 [Mycena capillaripes]